MRSSSQDDEILLDMLEDRNRSSHIYSSREAQKIFERIKSIYIPLIEKNLQKLEEKVSKA